MYALIIIIIIIHMQHIKICGWKLLCNIKMYKLYQKKILKMHEMS